MPAAQAQVHIRCHRCVKYSISTLYEAREPSAILCNEDRRAEKEGRTEGNIYLCEMRCAAFVQWAVTTAELPRSREKSGQRHQIKSRPVVREMDRVRNLSSVMVKSVKSLQFSNES